MGGREKCSLLLRWTSSKYPRRGGVTIGGLRGWERRANNVERTTNNVERTATLGGEMGGMEKAGRT